MGQAARHRRPGPPRLQGRDGYALLEVTLALMLIGMLATLALPGLVRATGPAALRVTAFRVSALLRDDRTEAQRSGKTAGTMIEEGGRRIRASSGAFVDMPAGAVAGILPSALGVRFFADGRASGGDVVIASDAARFTVSVNADTGAIRVVGP